MVAVRTLEQTNLIGKNECQKLRFLITLGLELATELISLSNI